ncbi:MAG: hypothetical protein ACM3X7_04750 [Solirubrobacterales bacterium]
MNNSKLAPHEVLELRELIDINIVGAKKVQASLGMVEDEELKTFMESCLETKKSNIGSMEKFIKSNLNI